MIDITRAKIRTAVEGIADQVEAIEGVRPSLRPLQHGDPAPAIREILFTLMRAAIAWAAGEPRRCINFLTRANIAITTLRMQLENQTMKKGPHR